MTIKQFMQKHFKHFNAASCVDAARGWVEQIDRGGKMFLTLAGAMSTAELGISLAALIRAGAVHAISCTGANLEEDLFNLVAHTHYERIPRYRDLTKEEEYALYGRGMNRVTDTCIPEEEAIRRIEQHLLAFWRKADQEGQRYFPHEVLYQLLESRVLEPFFEIDPKNSWLHAAWEKQLPIFVPGWEDSTTANIFVAHVMKGDLRGFGIVKSGVEL
jgi:deoxyhypusine synthase